jgi:hypothetical protein
MRQTQIMLDPKRARPPADATLSLVESEPRPGSLPRPDESTERRLKLARTWAAFLLLTLAIGCGDSSSPGDDDATAPTIVSITPGDGAAQVVLDGSVSATFSEDMNPRTLTSSTFTLRLGGTAVTGTVIYADKTVVFWPAAHLATNGSFDATITGAAESARGVPIAAKRTWTFTTRTTLAPGTPVRLGQAGTFAILARSAVWSTSERSLTSKAS